MNFIPQLYLRDDCKASDSSNPAVNCIVVNYAGNAVPVLENGHPADKRDLTTFCNMLSYTRLKVLKIAIFYCHSKRIHLCVMHSSISYL